MRTELYLHGILLLLLASTETRGFMDMEFEDMDTEYGKSGRHFFRKRFRRWQCDNGGGFGGNNFGGNSFGGNSFGGNHFGSSFGGPRFNLGEGVGAGAGSILGAGALLGPWGNSNLGDIDPTTYILLALLSGAGAAANPIPVHTVVHPEDQQRLIPLPSSGQQKSPTTEVPPIKSIDEFNDEISYALKPAPPPPPPVPMPLADPQSADKKAQGHVTPGNRCEDDSECVAHAECVEALRQKYCVCSPGRRPKGGMCV